MPPISTDGQTERDRIKVSMETSHVHTHTHARAKSEKIFIEAYHIDVCRLTVSCTMKLYEKCRTSKHMYTIHIRRVISGCEYCLMSYIHIYILCKYILCMEFRWISRYTANQAQTVSSLPNVKLRKSEM